MSSEQIGKKEFDAETKIVFVVVVLGLAALIGFAYLHGSHLVQSEIKTTVSDSHSDSNSFRMASGTFQVDSNEPVDWSVWSFDFPEDDRNLPENYPCLLIDESYYVDSNGQIKNVGGCFVTTSTHMDLIVWGVLRTCIMGDVNSGFYHKYTHEKCPGESG